MKRFHSAAVPLLLVLAGSVQAQAQQTPLTGAMAAPPVSAAPTGTETALPPTSSPFPAPAVAAPVAEQRPAVGDTTRALLRLQAAGTYAGPARPMLGDQATLAYQRYLQSFTHPIPERFEQAVSKTSTAQGQ